MTRNTLPLSRRGFLGAGAAGALTVGGGYALSRDAVDGSGRTYLLSQGKLRWTVTPLSQGDRTVEEFFAYDADSDSSTAGDLAATGAVSRLFVYSGPVDDSLAFLNGGPYADTGGTAAFSFSGIGRSKGEWAVRDDPTGADDDFEPWENGNSKVTWEWDAGETDGGAFWGSLDRSDYTIKVTPKTLTGVDAWRFLSGSVDAPERIDLSTEKPVSLRPAGDRTVKTVNAEIMPGEDPNVFDPYAKGSLTVALKPGAEVDPAEVDPGNYSVYFGSRDYLAGGNGAQPQKYIRRDGKLYLEYETKSANFSLSSDRGFVVGKLDGKTYLRGSDSVAPGGFSGDGGGELAVSDTQVDPAGDDADALVEEWVEFENVGEGSLDMGDWTLLDSEGWEFHMPSAFTLGAGETFRLHTGSGEWTDSDLYWGVERPVWDNDEDTVKARDADGRTVFVHHYTA